MRKSQIKQATNRDFGTNYKVFDKVLSEYITDSNDLMKGFLKRLEKQKMNNYYSVKVLENIYNYTAE